MVIGISVGRMREIITHHLQHLMALAWSYVLLMLRKSAIAVGN